MGRFSWLRADDLTEVANIYYKCAFKFLIPIDFGGGYIKDHYQDYGYLGKNEDGSPKYDIYEIIAMWNFPDKVKYIGKFPQGGLKPIDENTEHNRVLAICADSRKVMKYPPKLVSVRYSGTYEDLPTYSLTDPTQGSKKLYRHDMDYEGHKWKGC